MKPALLTAIAVTSALGAALVALDAGNASQPPRYRPGAEAIERAVAIAHDRALRAGGRPGRIAFAAAGAGR